MEVGAVLTAEKWLARSARLDPGDGRTDLMRAACYRRLEEVDGWFMAMQLAERKGAPVVPFEREHRLGLFQSGAQFDEGEPDWATTMLGAGVSQREFDAALVHRYLRLQHPDKAKTLLDRWSANYPADADVAYMTGTYWQSLGEVARAETEFENALTRQPRHELARAALANLMEGMNRLDEALEQYVELATLSAGADTVTVKVARLLRKLGHLDKARTELESLASRSKSLPGPAVEMGQIELECGNYEAAGRWFQRAGIEQTEDQDVLIGSSIAFALDGIPIRAEELFARFDKENLRSGRSYDLRNRLAVDPGDTEAAAELERLTSPPKEASQGRDQPKMPKTPEDREPNAVAQELYARHCAACHGDSGDGNGRAARHLFPRPRNLRNGKTRLVSARNGAPTRENLETLLTRGMPGTSMQSFEDLSLDEQKLLAQETLRLNREGVREEFIRMLTEEGEEIDESEVDQVVEHLTTPGQIVEVPQIGPADSPSIERGKVLYVRYACHSCHGVDGVGSGDLLLFDDEGRPTWSRDLVHDSFKGGHESASIYLRIAVGMPGTPHPACLDIAEVQIVDLVHYCGSLSQEPKRTLTNYQRALQATGGTYAAASHTSQ